MGRYCGEELSRRDINVGGNEVVIKFHSDFYLGKKGFLLVFTPVQPCKFKRNFLNVTKHKVAKGVRKFLLNLQGWTGVKTNRNPFFPK